MSFNLKNVFDPNESLVFPSSIGILPFLIHNGYLQRESHESEDLDSTFLSPILKWFLLNNDMMDSYDKLGLYLLKDKSLWNQLEWDEDIWNHAQSRLPQQFWNNLSDEAKNTPEVSNTVGEDIKENIEEDKEDLPAGFLLFTPHLNFCYRGPLTRKDEDYFEKKYVSQWKKLPENLKICYTQLAQQFENDQGLWEQLQWDQECWDIITSYDEEYSGDEDEFDAEARSVGAEEVHGAAKRVSIPLQTLVVKRARLDDDSQTLTSDEEAKNDESSEENMGS